MDKPKISILVADVERGLCAGVPEAFKALQYQAVMPEINERR